MAVRLAAVVMIDCQPIEPGAEVLLHPGHHAASEVAQIRQAVAILRCHDQAEGMPITVAALDKRARSSRSRSGP
jgi:hypothetical protein